MNTNKNIFTKKLEKKSVNNGNKVKITSLSVCIILVLISLLILVGIIS